MVRKHRYPVGVRPLLIEATARRKRIERRFIDALEGARFAEVVLPILDYVDAYAPVAGRDRAKQAYRFVDRDGELVALRSDFTPMVARSLAPSIAGEQLPLRVFYRGDVIRCDRTRLGSNREMFQIGAEVIGDHSVEADVEVLKLAGDLAGDAQIVYTDVRVEKVLAERSPAIREAALDDIRPFAPEAAQRLAATAAALDPRFVLRLGDADDSTSYYTGIRFAVYAGPSRSKIAQGGRYDNLYEKFGAAVPAIGFTFTIDDLD